MPCNSDHLKASQFETESRIACQCLVYVLPLLSRFPEKWIIDGCGYYGLRCDKALTDRAFSMLCDICSNMSEDEANKIIWDGRNSNARRLADWWENHQKEDEVKRNLNPDNIPVI